MLTQLKSIGLSDKESRVYLAMLELGPSPMLEIAAKAGINRPTAYVQIESLKKMGLVSTQTKGKKKLFIAEDPEQLGIVIDREKKLVEQKKEELLGILPELKNIFHLAGEQPLVRYFEGVEGLLKMQEEFLKVKEKLIIGIYSVDEVLAQFPEHYKTYTPRRIAKNIRVRGIYTSSKGPVLADQDNKKFLRELKYLPPEKLPITIDIAVFDDNIAISSLKGAVGGAIISHKSMADSLRGLFNLLWESAEKL